MRLREEVSVFQGMDLPAAAATELTDVVPGAATNTTRVGMGDYKQAMWHFEIMPASPGRWTDDQALRLHVMAASQAVAGGVATLKTAVLTGGQNVIEADVVIDDAATGDTVTVNGVQFTCAIGGYGPTSPLSFEDVASDLASAINNRFDNLFATAVATVTNIVISDPGNTAITIESSAATNEVRTRWACGDIDITAEETNTAWPFVFARLQNGGVGAAPASVAASLYTYCVALKSGAVYKPNKSVAAVRG